jgi:opine dehydrogenase
MKITVIGGGNIGTLMAAEMACKGHEVTVFTSHSPRWQCELTIWKSDDTLWRTGKIALATSDLEEAVRGAELIWVTLPAQMFGAIARKLEPLVQPGQMVGVVPGAGGAEFAFHCLIEKGCVFFGLQRVHSIARLKEYGRSVYMLGRKSSLQVGAIPTVQTEKIAAMLAQQFDLPCQALPNYLCVTMTPSNPILHTSRLQTMFADWQEGRSYPRNILFYEEWTDASSQRLLAMDDELQTLCERIPLPLETVRSLRDYYESSTKEAMTKKIRSIAAFKGLPSPMKEENGAWLPDLSSRYFTSDFSFGLKVLKEIAALFQVPTPQMDAVWDWYARLAPEDAAHSFRLHISQPDFLKLYQ